MTTKLSNPKDILGSGKVPLHLWPTTATVAGSMAFLDGALKYGRANWRAVGVRASIYHDAANRHLNAWFEGEDIDPDSGLPHLSHALACLAIIVDAQAAGKLEDDRMIEGGYRSLINSFTPDVARLKARVHTKEPHHYTVADNKSKETLIGKIVSDELYDNAVEASEAANPQPIVCHTCRTGPRCGCGTSAETVYAEVAEEIRQRRDEAAGAFHELHIRFFPDKANTDLSIHEKFDDMAQLGPPEDYEATAAYSAKAAQIYDNLGVEVNDMPTGPVSPTAFSIADAPGAVYWWDGNDIISWLDPLDAKILHHMAADSLSVRERFECGDWQIAHTHKFIPLRVYTRIYPENPLDEQIMFGVESNQPAAYGADNSGTPPWLVETDEGMFAYSEDYALMVPEVTEGSSLTQ